MNGNKRIVSIRIFSLLSIFILPAPGQAGVEPEWVSLYQLPGDWYVGANEIAVDEGGNSYIAGSSEGMAEGGDFVVVSFDPEGKLRWDYRIRGSDSTRANEARSIAVDRTGTVYAAGYLTNLETGRDWVVVSLNPAGTERWRYVHRPGNDVDGASCVILDKSGKHVYAGGYTSDQGTMLDFTVIAFDTSGGKKWLYSRNGSANQWDEVFALAEDGSTGRIYASGYTRNATTGMDFLVAGIDTAGNERSVYSYNGGANSWDESYDVAVDGEGAVYAAGYSRQSTPLMDWAVMKIDPGGGSLWQFFYKGDGDSMDWAERVMVDDRGNVYSAGTTTGTGTKFDMTLVKLDSLGRKKWVNTYDGPAHSDDESFDLVMDEEENAYLAGYSIGSSADLTVASFDSAGSQRWVYRYDGEGRGDDLGWSVACDGKGFVYACGTSTQSDGSIGLVAVKLKTDPPHGLSEKPEPAQPTRVPTLVSADRIYFEGRAEIFDYTGRMIYSGEAKSGRGLSGFAAGVYFIRAKEKDRWQWKKVVIVK